MEVQDLQFHTLSGDGWRRDELINPLKPNHQMISLEDRLRKIFTLFCVCLPPHMCETYTRSIPVWHYVIKQ